MFCPGCGANQSDDLKFCKTCGVNLSAVRQAAATVSSTPEKFDWSKTWVAEMFMSESTRLRAEEEMERRRGITPEIKRYNEIKDGVITTAVGAAVMIFLFVLMQGIIAAGVPAPAAHILSSVWVAGMIPFFVGLGLVFNGIVVSKKIVAAMNRQQESRTTNVTGPTTDRRQSFPEWNDSVSSVTENTTRQLQETKRNQTASE